MNATETLEQNIRHNREKVKDAYISVLKDMPLNLLIAELERRTLVSHTVTTASGELELSPDEVLVDVKMSQLPCPNKFNHVSAWPGYGRTKCPYCGKLYIHKEIEKEEN